MLSWIKATPCFNISISGPFTAFQLQLRSAAKSSCPLPVVGPLQEHREVQDEKDPKQAQHERKLICYYYSECDQMLKNWPSHGHFFISFATVKKPIFS